MRRIIASLDIGTYSIKLIVGEIQKGKLNILSCVDVASQGIKKGYIVNPESAYLALNEAFKKTEELIGFPITKVLVNVPCYDTECFASTGSVTITSEDKIVTHKDLIRAMQVSVYNQIPENKELVSILPTKFILNDEEKVSSPIDMVANKLTINNVAVIVSKKNTDNIIKCLEKMNIKISDICISPLADYYAFKDDNINSKIGAVVNIGQSNTTISIFNKGILTSCEVIDIGTSNIDSDLAYIFKIKKEDAIYLKENLTNCDIHLANPKETIMLKDLQNNVIKINEYDASAVVLSRLNELFDIIKKQINLLTKKEISYIITTGGISEISHFDRYLEQTFDNKVILKHISDLGARHNKYSVAVGMIKYYNSRLKLRNIDYSIFSLEEQEEFGGSHKRININENSLLGKIYGYFFDN